MHSKVDPAALMVAVFAVALGPLTDPGVWDVLDTYTAAIIGLVVICFTWPRADDEGRAPGFDRRSVLAQSVVYGFILGVALCWPAQSLLSDCWLLRTDVTCDLGESAAVHATFIAFGAGMLSIVGFYLLVRWKIKRLQMPPSEPQAVPESRSDVQRLGVGGPRDTQPNEIRGLAQVEGDSSNALETEATAEEEPTR